jgi:hypothetical protein
MLIKVIEKDDREKKKKWDEKEGTAPQLKKRL